MKKQIAVIGSSGGNLYNQGGSDVDLMMKEIFAQTESAGMEVAYIQFVGASGSMDSVSGNSGAALYTLQGGKAEKAYEGTLDEVNKMAEKADEELARAILEGKVDGIMLMSADPKGVNRRALTAMDM